MRNINDKNKVLTIGENNEGVNGQPSSTTCENTLYTQ